MEPIYRKEFHIDVMSVDAFGRLKPSMLLYYLQESAGGHFSTLEDPADPIAEKHLFWAVTRHRVQVSRLPVLGETVTVETWPMPTSRVAYPRAFVFYDSEGNEICRAVSLWVFMDSHTRGMVLPSKSGVTVNGMLRGTELEIPKSLLPRELPQSVTRTVTYSLLDTNEHMNNTRYLDWIDDLLPSAFHQAHPLKEFTVCYLSEAKEGQEIALQWQLLDGPCLQVNGLRSRTDTPEKQERIFAAQLLF